MYKLKTRVTLSIRPININIVKQSMITLKTNISLLQTETNWKNKTYTWHVPQYVNDIAGDYKNDITTRC